MKKVFAFLTVLIMFACQQLFAQAQPEGMNYQAVARNLKGEILANQPVSLRISLFSMGSNSKSEYFREVHEITTSMAGVFSLIVGKGTPEFGIFKDIPWSTENIWLEVSIKSKGEAGFTSISNSKLLAVPYAFHSLTASKLTDQSNSAAGVPSQSWLLFGNSNSNPLTDKLGVTDSVDLVMVTNNIERQRIYANGNIYMKRSLRVGADLNVDSSAYLNKLGGATINYGPLTVERQSPTLLSGTLTVDRATDLNASLNVDGTTDLNSRLNVNNSSPTTLTGTLRVDGATDLNSRLNVNNVSPTLLTGTLQVNKDGLFKEKVLLDNATHQSTSTTTGALVVNGGFGLGGNLNVGGRSAFGGPVSFASAVTISDRTQSVDTTTGALIVGGGVAIGKQLNVGEGAFFESTLRTKGLVDLQNNTQSTTSTNGALKVAGGAGIAQNVNIGGNLTTTGITTLNNQLTVNANGGYVANFVNAGNANGINIQVETGAANNNNDFVTFRKSGGAVVGRIEGETLNELRANTDYIIDRDAFIFEVTTGSVDLAIAGFEVAQAVVDVAASLSSSTACVGFGACITAPIPAFIIASGTNLVLKIANAASSAASLAGAITTRNRYIDNLETNIGVTYQSGSADYAEWLPKANPVENFSPGAVVGLKNGKISLNTSGADKLFVISTKPIVLGNMPVEGKESSYEKVAFMGQVPVYVLGNVKTGDYILPSGKNNGLAIAISPDKMKPEDYQNIVGMAWSASTNSAVSLINVAIGLNTGDISKLVAEQNKEISSLKAQISETNNILAKLVPGFKEAAGIKDVTPAVSNPIVSSPVYAKDNRDGQHEEVVAGPSDIVFFELRQDQLDAMFAMAEKIFVENGGDINTDPFWKRIKNEPGFKEATMAQVKEKFRHALHTHQDINKQYLKGK